jgi:hypothetical protein
MSPVLHVLASALQMPDNSFDLYTIAFGIRNVPNVQLALDEAFRVLKPGGRFMCMEFSHVALPVVKEVYDAVRVLVSSHAFNLAQCCLSRPSTVVPWFSHLCSLQYSFNVIPKLGELVANDRDSYQVCHVRTALMYTCCLVRVPTWHLPSLVPAVPSGEHPAVSDADSVPGHAAKSGLWPCDVHQPVPRCCSDSLWIQADSKAIVV